jgi:putative peptidoglycan lipid II flippase
VGVVAGSLGLLLVQLPPLRQAGFRFSPRIDLADDQARKVLTLMGPRVLGLSASQITMVVMTSLATLVGLGAVSAFTLAFAIYQIPMGVIGIPLGIVILPSLSRELAVGRTESYLELVSRSLRILLFVMLPIAAIGVALRLQVVELLLGYGRFDAAAVQQTADTLTPFLLGLPGHALIGVLARAFYARHDTKTPVWTAILAVVINTALGALLVGQYGLPALAAAIAIAAWVEALALVIVLRGREPDLDLSGVASVGLRSLVAAVIAGGVAIVVEQALVSVTSSGPDKLLVLVEAVIATAVAGLAYAGVALLLRVPELNALVSVARSLLRRRSGTVA